MCIRDRKGTYSNFMSVTFEICGGDQARTFGGMVREQDKDMPRALEDGPEPSPSRGLFSGGCRAQRRKARELANFTAEEISWHESGCESATEMSDSRQKELSKIVEAQKKVREAKQRQNASKNQRGLDKVLADEFRWPCSGCWKEKDGVTSDCFNYGNVGTCYKCRHPRPAPEDADWEDHRWKCRSCEEGNPGFTLPCNKTCHLCGRQRTKQDIMHQIQYLSLIHI